MTGGVCFKLETDSPELLNIGADDVIVIVAAFSEQEWVQTHPLVKAWLFATNAICAVPAVFLIRAVEFWVLVRIGRIDPAHWRVCFGREHFVGSPLTSIIE